MKRLLTTVMATIIAMAGLLFAASPGSAHHTTVSGTVSCFSDDTFKISWTVTNWSGGGPATVTGSSRNVVPAGTQIADGGAKTFTEIVSTAADITMEVTGSWRDGQFTTTNRASIGKDRFPTDCAPAEQPVTPAAPSTDAPTCDTDGRLVVPNDTHKVRYEQTPSGTGPGTYTVTAIAKPGYKIDGQSSWTLTVDPKRTGPECDIEVTPVAPVITAIKACGEYGSITMLGQEGIAFTILEGNTLEGPYTIEATALDGYVIAPGAETLWTGDLGQYVACTEVVPVAPQASAITACGEYGVIELPDTEGVAYELVEGNGQEGPWKVVATAEQGYVLADGAATEFSGDLGQYADCTPVTPVAPTVEQTATCAEPGSLVLPETTGVVYTLVEGDGQWGPWKVIATLEDGYVLTPDAVTVWSGDLGEATECGVGGHSEEKEPQDTGSGSGTSAGSSGGASGGQAVRQGVLPNTGAGSSALLLAMLGLMLVAGGMGMTQLRLRRTV
ncbi:LPXTG cell wall anchor domain-containing protein [Nocardioides sp.]|uniref:LPXTG cell wall anchor domain-containing protein n=1 Tax=Nocardioides sp. TaxID=35761 RepID=UPI002736D121|nr:LPXTG cell wall anchor domain-containing protein [Nocardioides sp.]MDP3893410.1 LPXTG cell wall anchor domain-containing protein [Nocardioides sp.]